MKPIDSLTAKSLLLRQECLTGRERLIAGPPRAGLLHFIVSELSVSIAAFVHGANICCPPMLRSILCSFLLLSGASLALAQQPFLTSEQWVKLRDEANGAAPYENLRYLTRWHRVPVTAGNSIRQLSSFCERGARVRAG